MGAQLSTFYLENGLLKHLRSLWWNFNASGGKSSPRHLLKILRPQCRLAQPNGMVAPVTCDKVLTALKGMKDGAPSPDGRKLKDQKGIPLTELQCHFNLWPLAGYQPTALGQGKMVLMCDPAQHWPITMTKLPGAFTGYWRNTRRTS